MALQKEINYDNGTSSSYHRITSITTRFSGDSVYVSATVWSYTTQAQRQLKADNPVVSESYDIIMTESEFSQTANIRSHLYEHLKTLPAFEGATDC